MKVLPGNFTVITLAFLLAGCGPETKIEQAAQQQRMMDRATSLELQTEYVAPPGDSLEHHAAGFAKIMCSAVFITGLDPDFAAENVGYFTAPYASRALLGKPVIDEAKGMVHIPMPNGRKRTAVYTGSQGCVCLPIETGSLYYQPRTITSTLPEALSTEWPMGDIVNAPFPEELDEVKVMEAVNAAFEQPEGLTAAFVVTWKGNVVGRRYGSNIHPTTPLESWSMGKSITSTLMGILIHRGVYSLNQPAPIPEWQGDSDPRSKITIANILNMSSGIRIRAPQDPDYDPSLGYPDHLYLYTGGVNSFQYAATRPQQWPPNTVGRYRNTDPVLANYLIKLGVEKLGEDYLSFPQRALFDKIGIQTLVIETDPYGNFLTQGYDLGSALDWARLGNLYLQDGVWGGKRILPEGFVSFVSTVAPAWKEDERPVYGGFFWINGTGTFPIPKEAYYMAGAGGQYTIIIPSHDLVVVRLGHFKGSKVGTEGLKTALAILMEAVPKH